MKEKVLERLALVAALPQECWAVLKWPGWKRVSGSKDVSMYALEGQGRVLRLAVGGMGERRARVALGVLLESFDADGILSFGFGGALDPGLQVGEVVVGGGALMWKGPGQVVFGDDLHWPWEASGLKKASVISAPGFVSKLEVIGDLPLMNFPAVLDLETFALARDAARRGIPFFSIRAISDEFALDVGPRIRNLVDEQYRIRPSRMLLWLLSRPWEWLLLWRLFRRSRVASRALGKVLHEVLMKS